MKIHEDSLRMYKAYIKALKKRTGYTETQLQNDLAEIFGRARVMEERAKHPELTIKHILGHFIIEYKIEPEK